VSLVRFCYNNLIDDSTITYSSQSPNFPASNLTHRWHTKTWRTRYGTGTGWGNFVITAGTNDDIDFKDSGTTTRLATVDAGSYTADTLSTEIESKMEAQTTDTFDVEYLDATNKFKITNDVGNFELLCSTGANQATAIWSTTGFSTSADKTGVDNYTADNLRIHSEEYAVFNLGSAQTAQAFIIRNNNFQSDATVKIQGHTSDSWSSPQVTYTFGTIDTDIMIYFWATEHNLQYWRYYFADIDNSDGYIESGRIFLGQYFSPATEARRDYSESINDPSDVLYSKGGQISSNIETQFRTVKLVFDFANQSDLNNLQNIFDSLGTYKDMFVCIDTGSTDTRTYYMKLSKDLDIDHIIDENLWKISVALEELR